LERAFRKTGLIQIILLASVRFLQEECCCLWTFELKPLSSQIERKAPEVGLGSFGQSAFGILNPVIHRLFCFVKLMQKPSYSFKSSRIGERIIDDEAEDGNEDFVVFISTFSSVVRCRIPGERRSGEGREMRIAEPACGKIGREGECYGIIREVRGKDCRRQGKIIVERTHYNFF
jgi:hypothetical protein